MNKLIGVGVGGALLFVGLSGYVYLHGMPFAAEVAQMAGQAQVNDEKGTMQDAEKKSEEPAAVTLAEKDLPKKVGESVQKNGYTITREDAPVAVQTVKKNTIPLPVLGGVPLKPAGMPFDSYTLATSLLVALRAEMNASVRTSTVLPNESWLQIAQYYNMLGDHITARAVWLYLVSSEPGLFQPYGNLANQYVIEQNFTEAAVWYTRAIEKKADYLQYYSDLADVYVAQKNTTAAADTLKKGIVVDTKGWALHVALGRLYNTQGNLSEAHKVLNEAIARAKKAGNDAVAAEIEKEKIYTQ
jgi:tetratricopeptide (TPR) repeat protein